MGDGTEKSPYTREDVLRLIEENGDKAKGLDLSGKVFEARIDLRKLNMSGIILKEARLNGAHLEKASLLGAHLEGAILFGAHLEEARLFDAHLEKAALPDAHLEGTDLSNAHLEGASLSSTHLEGASLSHAHLDGVFLSDARLSPETRLEDAQWGGYVLGEEKHRLYGLAESAYRALKQWHTTAGLYDIAGKFYYREMECKRKALSWRRNFWSRLGQTIYWFLCGYGEKWERVITSALVVIFGSAVVYYIMGNVLPHISNLIENSFLNHLSCIGTLTPNSFWDCLYYSAVSFTALGYGSWVKEASGLIKLLGVVETFIGVFMMALFLITFTRKMTR